MKNWIKNHEDLVVEKIIPTIVVITFVAMMVINFDPTEWIISAEWLLGSIY